MRHKVGGRRNVREQTAKAPRVVIPLLHIPIFACFLRACLTSGDSLGAWQGFSMARRHGGLSIMASSAVRDHGIFQPNENISRAVSCAKDGSFHTACNKNCQRAS